MTHRDYQKADHIISAIRFRWHQGRRDRESRLRVYDCRNLYNWEFVPPRVLVQAEKDTVKINMDHTLAIVMLITGCNETRALEAWLDAWESRFGSPW